MHTFVVCGIRDDARGIDAAGEGLSRGRHRRFVIFYVNFFLDIQFKGASARMRQVYDEITKAVSNPDKSFAGDFKMFL